MGDHKEHIDRRGKKKFWKPSKLPFWEKPCKENRKRDSTQVERKPEVDSMKRRYKKDSRQLLRHNCKVTQRLRINQIILNQ